jgi:hypothetical protein
MAWYKLEVVGIALVHSSLTKAGAVVLFATGLLGLCALRRKPAAANRD